ncbi:MAG: hypothetical protein RLZZ324_289 [Candidatus Parcubacteria bacterium]|jgi:glycosyltransferase involved in cell wall biosynthesis
MKAVIVIPTYNERENLEPLVRGVFSRFPVGGAQPATQADNAVRAIVVDDASPDGTGAIADRLAAEFPDRLSIIHRQAKSGLGSAYQDGFRAALAGGATHVCSMDADGSHDAAALSAMLRAAGEGAAVVIGSRRVQGGAITGWGPHRHMMSAGAAWFARVMLGLRTHDVTSGFRCYSRAATEALLAARIHSDGYAFQEETLFHCERLGFSVRELPITFRDRTLGASKLSWKEIPAFFRTIIRLRRAYRSTHRLA